MSAEVTLPHGRAAQESRKAKLQRTAYEELTDRGDVIWLLKHAEGRRFLRRLIEKSGYWRSPFNQNAMEFSKAEGTRAYAMWVMSIVAIEAPGLFTEMLMEQVDASNSNREPADGRNTKQRPDGT